MVSGMTSRERVRAALQHREPDRTPIFEYVLLSPVADGLLGRRYGGDKAHWREMVDELGWSGALDRSIVDRLDMAELLGHDMLYVGPNPPERPAGSPSAIEDKSANGGPVAAMVRRNGVASGAPAPGSDTFEIYGRLGREMERRGLDLPRE